MVAPGDPATKWFNIQDHDSKTIQLIGHPEISKVDIEEGSQHNSTLKNNFRSNFSEDPPKMTPYFSSNILW